EFYAMTLEDRTDRLASVLAGGATAAALYWLSPLTLYGLADDPPVHGARIMLAAMGPMLVLILAVMPIGLYYLFRVGDMKTVATRIAYSVAGIVYVAVTLTFLAMTKRDFGSWGA